MTNSLLNYLRLACLGSTILCLTNSAAEDYSALKLPVEKTNLNPAFTLIGIVYRPKPESSFIYIRNDANIISSFSGNEYVDGNWRITSIQTHSVSLQNKHSSINLSLQYSDINQKLTSEQELKISEVKSRTLDQDFNRKLKNYINGRVLASVPYPYGVKSYGIEMVSTNEYLIDKRLFQEQIDHNKIADHFKFEIDGGFKLTEIVPGSLFDIAGLEPGDNINSFNNQPIETVADVLSLTREFLNHNKMNIELKRNNTALNYQYHIINAGISGE